jgi:hypothetical protein
MHSHYGIGINSTSVAWATKTALEQFNEMNYTIYALQFTLYVDRTFANRAFGRCWIY